MMKIFPTFLREPPFKHFNVHFPLLRFAHRFAFPMTAHGLNHCLKNEGRYTLPLVSQTTPPAHDRMLNRHVA